MSDTEALDILFLPEELRYQFCYDLLIDIGADKIKVVESKSEINACCPLPWHNDTHPSFSLNWEKMVASCFSCGSGGGILWFIGAVKGVNGPRAREWLTSQTGITGSDFDLPALLAFIDAAIEGKKKPKISQPIPRYPERMLEPWDHIYPGMTTGVPDLGIPGRGIPEDNLRHARVGWDLDSNRVTIPHFWRGDLVGWQSRRIMDDGTPKYLSSPDFPRDRTIYGYDEVDQSKPVLVVESPMSRLRHLHHLPIVSTFGSEITERQITLLKWFPKVVFWMDNDKAGWWATLGKSLRTEFVTGAPEKLSRWTEVMVVESDWAADPAELSDTVAHDLYDAAVPFFLWEKPQGALRCLKCQERHGGPCGG